MVNNARVGVEVKILECGYWGQMQIPDVHSFTTSNQAKASGTRAFPFFDWKNCDALSSVIYNLYDDNGISQVRKFA